MIGVCFLVKFIDYEFGYADAEKEYTRVPEIFEDAFYDLHNTVTRLIKDHYFLLIGRKGVGKSAVRAKIQSLAENTTDFFAYPVQLNDFEFSTFSKTAIDKNITGTKKYKDSWDFILLLMAFKIIYKKLNVKENEKLNKTKEFLGKIGFPLETNLRKDVTGLSKLKIGGNIANFDIKFEKEFGTRPVDFLERISTINEKMLSVLKNIWFAEGGIVILIDGLDDILRYKKNQLEILASLIRSADYLNDYFFSNKTPIKIVLFIREDIINNVTDPDLNKIKRDGAILLNWHNNLNDLKSVVNLRFKHSGVENDRIEKHWDYLFPRKIKNKNSWFYILDHTLYKPRDILQFLKCCQELYPLKQNLTYSEVRNALKTYSRDYFLEEMKNEITGFVDDDHINALPSVLQKIGERSFYFSEFRKIMEEQSLNKILDEHNIKHLLLLLFEAGYIGQLIPNTRDNRLSVIFKYRNPNSTIDYSQKFITHRGIYNGLGVRLKQ